jgi:uncharacterized membrane protein YkoI
MRRPVVGIALMLAAALSAMNGFADEGDHDRARRALEAGEIMPLSQILDRVERDYPGRVVEIELDRDDGRWIYEIKMLRDGGRLLKLKVDARDARVLRVKGRDAEKTPENATRSAP